MIKNTYFVGAPTLQNPVSQICTAAQFAEDDFLRLMDAIKQQPRLHRKQWEYAYILRVLEQQELLRAGRTAVGFGCGGEPLSAVMAGLGMSVTTTEHPGYHPNGEARSVSSAMDLFYGGICAEEIFRHRVNFRAVDMTQLPPDLGEFDALWSCSALEELGSIAAGADFVLNSMRCLRRGGVGVFTTQLNLGNDQETIERPNLSVWRRLDILNLQARVVEAGHEMLPICLTAGQLPEDHIVDTPPYSNPVHLKILVDGHTVTSVGFAVRKL